MNALRMNCYVHLIFMQQIIQSQVNVNKIICRYTQGNNQKEVLSGQKMIGSIFLEISVW